MTQKYGKFYGVGVGPGDPELITVKALNILKNVPVVFVPVSKEGKESYALSIVKKHLDFRRQKKIELLFPMKKNQEELTSHWDKAVEEILGIAKQGTDSVFITEGDPFFYSTFIYLHAGLAGKIPPENIEVVPGVTSFCASASLARFPVANGNAKLAVLPSVYDLKNVENILDDFDTVVFMKVNKVLGSLMELIEKKGLKDKWVYVEKCGTEAEKITKDPRELKKITPHYLSLLIVRK